jgi:hypothetical protein
MKSSFLIIADRGNLKAFRVEAVPNGRARLNMVQGLTFADAHLKVSEKNTDISGRYSDNTAPNQAGGRHQASTWEKHPELETGKRLAREIAQQITTILEQEQPANWSFAAPGEINAAILAELAPNVRNQIAENLHLDLVNVPTNSLLDRFQVRAVEAA